jgi:hypothetical protein
MVQAVAHAPDQPLVFFVEDLTFGPDGQLFTGGVDATALAWDPRFAKPPTERK